MINKDLTHASVLTRNTIWNLFGYGTPLAVAIIAIPFLIKGMGTERFGILTLAWVFIGYLSLLDLGLGRTLTKVVAEKLGAGKIRRIPETIWTALFIMTAMGLLIAVMTHPLIPWTMISVLKIPSDLLKESIDAFRLLAWCIPVIIVSVGLRGILEAYQRFDMINTIRIPLGIYTFCAPLLIIPITGSIFWVIAVIIFGRVIAAFVQFYFCCKVVSGFLQGIRINKTLMPYIFRFGGWMSITNAVNPILLYIDRYFISSLLSISVVAYYATPSEVVTKLLLISGALTSVLFPAFSATFSIDRQKAVRLMKQGNKYIYIIIYPIVLLIVTFSKEGLSFWIGPEFANHSFKALQWMAAGVFVRSLTQVPFAFIQGAGRPDLIAKMQLLELPVYLLLLWRMIVSFGIWGAAVVWFLRLTVDMLGMYWLSQLVIGEQKLISKRSASFLVISLFILVLVTIPNNLSVKLAMTACLFSVFTFISWHFLLKDGIKLELRRYIRRIFL